MKTLKLCLAIALLINLTSAIVILQKLYAADNIDKGGTASIDQNEEVKASIMADMNKIAHERDMIIADRRRLQEVKKTGDKIKIEQVKQEITEDIKKRKAAIKDLYSGIANKTPASLDLEPRKRKVK